MNPRLEYASVLWHTLDPNVPIEVAKLKLKQVLDMGFVAVSVQVNANNRKGDISIYNDLVQCAVSTQKTRGVIDLGLLGQLQLSDVFYDKVNILYRFYNVRADPNGLSLTSLPFGDLEIDELAVETVTDVFNHAFYDNYIQVLKLV